jgi:hypothetical protein
MGVLSRIKAAVSEGRYEVTEHAAQEAEADGFGPLDIVNAIREANHSVRYTRDPRGPRYKLHGRALDGRVMYLVCRFTELRELRVITVFAEDDES